MQRRWRNNIEPVAQLNLECKGKGMKFIKTQNQMKSWLLLFLFSTTNREQNKEAMLSTDSFKEVVTPVSVLERLKTINRQKLILMQGISG